MNDVRGTSGQRITAVLVAVIALGCGARTALDEPCIIPLELERPAVVFLAQWDGQCDNYRGGCFPDTLFEGRDLFEAVRYTLANVVPVLDEIALLGAMPTQTIRLGDGTGGDLPIGDERTAAWCATPSELTVPIGAGHGARVEQYFSVEEWPHRQQPTGQATVLPNVPVVERALLAVGTERTPRFIILIDSGNRGCPGPDGFTSISDARYAEIRDVLAGPASRGVRTLVVGLRRFTVPDGYPFLNQEAILNAEAEGGGLARDDDAPHPIRFYDYADMPAIEAVLRERIVAPYYCTLYAAAPVTHPEDVVLIAPGGGEAPPRDPSRTDGWDFLDDSHQRIGLFGAACEHAITSPQQLSMLVHGGEC